MRQRSSLLVTLCLCAAVVALPATAQGPDREGGNARFELRDLWAGLVAWVAAFGLDADPNGLTASFVAPDGGGPASVPDLDDEPAFGLDADPNG